MEALSYFEEGEHGVLTYMMVSNTYKYVYQYELEDELGVTKLCWLAEVMLPNRIGSKSRNLSFVFDTEKGAAKAVDRFLIQNGQPPVNILKPLQKRFLKELSS